MQNYKVSDLFRRAKQLADLEGSDFISWNEAEISDYFCTCA